MGRLLEPADFGEFALASVVVTIALIFSKFGFGPALVQRRNLRNDDISFVFLVTLVIDLAATGALIVASAWISRGLEEKVAPLMISVLALNLIFSAVGTIPRFLLVRDLEFRKIFAANSVSYVLGNLVVGCLLYTSPSPRDATLSRMPSSA